MFGIGIVTLNRAEKLKAFDEELHSTVEQAWPLLSANPDINVIVLPGEAARFPPAATFAACWHASIPWKDSAARSARWRARRI